MLRLDSVIIRQDDFQLSADWQVKTGARIAVIGPSGAGKSTLLSAIAGFQPLAGGSIWWDATNLLPLLPGERPLSILFQDQNLFPHLSIIQNVGLGLRPDLRLSAEQRDRIDTVLKRVGLGQHGKRRPAELSGGERGRAALARAIIRGRPLLLLDEPFSALGPALRQDMLTLLHEVVTESGITTLLVTHSPEDARRFADQIVLVADSIAAPPVETEQLFANPPPDLARYLGEFPAERFSTPT